MQILQKGGVVEVVIALISVAANAAQTRHEVAGDTCGKVRGAVRITAGYDTKQVGAKAGGGVRERGDGANTCNQDVGAHRLGNEAADSLVYRDARVNATQSGDAREAEVARTREVKRDVRLVAEI